MGKLDLVAFAGMPAETAQAICCMIFGGVLERYPRLKVCFARMEVYINFIKQTMFCLITCWYIHITLYGNPDR